MMLTNSILGMLMNHPISMGVMLMLQSITTSLITILITKNSWHSMILFITFSSGLMIMFMYMASISSNEKFKWSFKLMLAISTMMILLMMIMNDKLILFKNKINEQNLFMQDNEEKKTMLKMISTNKAFSLLMMTMVILTSLISISNLINSFEGPLKKTYVKNLKYLKNKYKMLNF